MRFRLSWALAAALLSLGVAGFWYLWSPTPDAGALGGRVEARALLHEGLQRRYRVYVPAQIAARPQLWIVLHGSQGDGPKMRRWTGYGFDRLADRHGDLVVYPDGFEAHWNDCRRVAAYSARTQNIDDLGFLRALAQQFRTDMNVAAVHVVGFSNGGHMAFRLALEAPGDFDGYAAIAANLPSADNSVCPQEPAPVRMLLVNGMRDPINPYDGGRVTLFGFGDRGEVRSASDSARFFAQAYGNTAVEESGSEPVSWRRWRYAGHAVVGLATIPGGGHAVPQPYTRLPRLFGRTEQRFDATAAIRDFLAAGRS